MVSKKGVAIIMPQNPYVVLTLARNLLFREKTFFDFLVINVSHTI